MRSDAKTLLIIAGVLIAAFIVWRMASPAPQTEAVAVAPTQVDAPVIAPLPDIEMPDLEDAREETNALVSAYMEQAQTAQAELAAQFAQQQEASNAAHLTALGALTSQMTNIRAESDAQAQAFQKQVAALKASYTAEVKAVQQKAQADAVASVALALGPPPVQPASGPTAESDAARNAYIRNLRATDPGIQAALAETQNERASKDARKAEVRNEARNSPLRAAPDEPRTVAREQRTTNAPTRRARDEG